MQTTISKPELPKLNITYEEIKSIVIDKIKGDTIFQFMAIVSRVASFVNASNIGFEKVANTSYDSKLNQRDEGLIREIIWDLIIQRIVTIGDFHNHNWPYLSLTEYGKSVLNSDEPIPHDPSKYINRVQKEIPNIDHIITTYLSESINTYNINQLLSSTIALGCASEKTFLLLIDTYQNTFNNVKNKERFEQKVKNRMIKVQYEEFVGVLPKNLSDNYENILLGVFEMFRNQRNHAGHPTGQIVDKVQLFANLQVFVGYCKRVYSLIEYLNKQKHD